MNDIQTATTALEKACQKAGIVLRATQRNLMIDSLAGEIEEIRNAAHQRGYWIGMKDGAPARGQI